MFQSAKAKSAVKIALPRSNEVSEKALLALKKTAEIVGSTLGPYGAQVLIERQEQGLKPFTTKDGVTVHKNIGYSDPVEQVVLEAARDAAVRTAQEAGDGTTTATILSYAIARQVYNRTKGNRKAPPQKIVREINSLIPEIESQIKERVRMVGEDYYSDLLKVASLSANGDVPMAEVIMEAFDLVGDQGNITLTEEYGQPGYKVEKFQGFTIEKGYEESCEQFYSVFINDPSGMRVFLEDPTYILFDGQMMDINTLAHFVAEIDAHMKLPENADKMKSKNIVLVAHKFSKQVLATLAANFTTDDTFKIFPLLSTQSFVLNSQTQFLHDVAAFTGAKVFNPIARPIQSATFEDLIAGKSKAFEATRYRSNILGAPDEESVGMRVAELEALKANPESVYDRMEIESRIGKLTCGVAKVKVIGPSQSEIRERKDRAEDAWCAVRAAIKHGTLPGGGWTLVQLSDVLHRMSEDAAAHGNSARALATQILSHAFLAPIEVLYSNAGFNAEEIEAQVHEMRMEPGKTYNLQEGKWVGLDEVIDSAPAVMEAIRNSISIATLMGTLGGVVVFARDRETDQSDAADWNRHVQAIQDGDSTATAMEIEDRNS